MTLPVAIILVLTLTAAAIGDSLLTGTSIGQPSGEYELGLWKYCVDVVWDSGTPPRGLSHLDLVLDLEECGCACWNLGFDAHNPAGSSSGEARTEPLVGVDVLDPPPGESGGSAYAVPDPTDPADPVDEDECTVYYIAEFKCDGDPTVPGLERILVKFEPMVDQECEPGPRGSGTYCFYADWPPVAVSSGNLLLVVKAGQRVYYGELSGYLPGCAFPSATESLSWSTLRQIYR